MTQSTVRVNAVDLVGILALAAGARTPETEAMFARVWVSVRRQAPEVVGLLDRSEGRQSAYRRRDLDGGEG